MDPITSPLSKAEALSRLRAGLGAVLVPGSIPPMKLAGKVYDPYIRLLPSNLGSGGHLYRPILQGSLEEDGEGSRLTGYIVLPGRKFGAAFLGGIALFLVVVLLAGLLSAMRGTPILTEGGTPMFPSMVWPPLFMLPAGAVIHFYYSRRAAAAAKAMEARLRVLLETDAPRSAPASG